MLDAYMLGASLYVPATHPKLASILAGTAYPQARSLIACTEDAIGEAEVDDALERIRGLLARLPALTSGPLRFVRPRNLEVLIQLLAMPGIERIHGFVIPKADHRTLPAYLEALERTGHVFMPTIETSAAFDVAAMVAMREVLDRDRIRERCLAIRIGGNDLLRVLGMRRPLNSTIYDTPVGALIPQLVMMFKPYGFKMTGAVMDQFNAPELLAEEARRDRLMGLDGKSAVHPRQVEVIEAVFAVAACELAAAHAVLDPEAPAVFQIDGTMLEAAVHRPWAEAVMKRHAALTHTRPRQAAEDRGADDRDAVCGVDFHAKILTPSSGDEHASGCHQLHDQQAPARLLG